MNNCNYCGEFKRVRFIEDLNSIIMNYGLVFSRNEKFGKYICEDCNKAIEIKKEKDKKESIKINLKQQEKWKKERDNILKSSQNANTENSDNKSEDKE